MPVTVNLMALASVRGTRPLWPPDFAAFVDGIERRPGERTQYGACADWLDEHAAEPRYARAFRWLMTRTGVCLKKNEGAWIDAIRAKLTHWTVLFLPELVRREYDAATSGDAPIDYSTAAGAMAALAAALERAEEKAKKALEDLA